MEKRIAGTAASKGRLSVFIITLDEEKNIRRCLESCAWADEIIVVDSGSVDKTADIARLYTPRFYVKEFRDYATQKNYAMSLTTGDWLLSLDADEAVSPELRREIESILSSPAALEAYLVRRRSVIFGRTFRFTGTQHDWQTRLFRKGAASFEQPIHEKVLVNGRMGRLSAWMTHHTYPTVSAYMKRFNRYTSMEAGHLRSSQRPAGRLCFSLRPFLLFLKRYFWEKGFMDGTEGFIFSVLSGYYVFVKHAKRREWGAGA
jgi:glycosyltransferase involved in cell wall biosynthesis